MSPISPHRPMTLVAALATALLVSFALLALPAGASAAKLKSNLKGVQVASITPDTTADTLDADLGQAQKLGAKVVRTDIHWSYLEPDAAGQEDSSYLAQVDHAFARAKALKLKVFLTVLGMPCWTTTAPSPDCASHDGRALAEAYPPADNAAFGRFAAFVAQRYHAQLAALEIWNEPDQRNELYWKGPDKVGHYAALLKAAYPAIKAAAPKVPVAGAAIVG